MNFDFNDLIARGVCLDIDIIKAKYKPEIVERAQAEIGCTYKGISKPPIKRRWTRRKRGKLIDCIVELSRAMDYQTYLKSQKG